MLHPKLLNCLPKPIACRLLGPLLTRFAEEALLTDEQRSVVNTHLTTCLSCREEVEAIRAIGSLLRNRGPVALPAVLPAPDLWSRIEAQMDAEVAAKPAITSPAVSRPYRSLAVFAPALAAMVLGAVFLGPHLLPTAQAPISAARVTKAVPDTVISATKGLAMAPKASEVANVTGTDVDQPAIRYADNATSHWGARVGAAHVGAAPVIMPSAPAQILADRGNITSGEPSKRLLDSARRQALEAGGSVGPTMDVADASGNPVKRTSAAGRGAIASRAARRDPFTPVAEANGTMVAYNGFQAKSNAATRTDKFAAVGGAASPVAKMEDNTFRSASPLGAIPAPANPLMFGDTSPSPGAASAVSSKAAYFAANAHQRDIIVKYVELGPVVSTYAKSPAEQLNRQQQRRSLFGGYGVAVSAAMLSNGNGGNGGAASGPTPW